jgi:hypothetical protein
MEQRRDNRIIDPRIQLRCSKPPEGIFEAKEPQQATGDDKQGANEPRPFLTERREVQSTGAARKTAQKNYNTVGLNYILILIFAYKLNIK